MKDGRRQKDKANGKHENDLDAGMMRKGKDKSKSKKKGTNYEDEIQKDHEAKFRKLAALANYGDIETIRPPVIEEEKRPKKVEKKQKKKSRKNADSSLENYDEDAARSDSRGRGKADRLKDRRVEDSRPDRPERGNLDRSYEREDTPDSKDDFDARNYAQDIPQHARRDRKGGYHSDRGGREGKGHRSDIGSGGSGREDRGGGRREKRRSKKQRDYMEPDDDADIRIERTFERLDMYEDKFEEDRQRNLDVIRGKDEFRDYFNDRDVDNQRRDNFDDRDRDGRGDFRGWKGDRGYERGDRADRGIPPVLEDEGRRREPRGEKRGGGIVVKDQRRRR